MTALDDKITALEVKINGYETQLETLNRLLDERKAQSAGKFICGSI